MKYVSFLVGGLHTSSHTLWTSTQYITSSPTHYRYCTHGNLSDLTIIALIATPRHTGIRVELYAFYSSSCCIQGVMKLLKISGAVITITANLRKNGMV